MPFNTLIQRSDVDTRIPQAESNLMLNSLYETSSALALGTRIPMPAASTRFPVLSALPMAYWVNGDTGLKQTSTMAWDNKFINVEELAVIVPVPENVLDDVDFDVWAEVRPAMETAISRKIDEAVFIGTDKPASFPDSLAAGAAAAGNVAVRGATAASAGGIHGDIETLVALVEDDGYVPTDGIYRAGLRSMIRRSLIPADSPVGGVSVGDWYGANMRAVLPGLWPTAVSTVEALVGDFSQLVVGVRRDFDYKILDQGVITDNTNAIIFNLPQQDMIALRVTFRMGFQVANPINFDNLNAGTRYPFARLNRPAV